MSMKFLAHAAPAALALSAIAAVPAPAAAAGGGTASIAEMCNSGLAEAFGISVGTCVLLMRDGDAVATCKFLKDQDLLEVFGYRNQGDCIRAQR